MPDHKQDTVSELISRFQGQDDDFVRKLAPLVYEELRRLASKQLRRGESDSPVNTTSLVHEAYLRLVDLKRIDWQSRGHFLAIAGIMMRRIVIDLVRKKLAEKRGGNVSVVEFNEEFHGKATKPDVLIRLDDALTELEAVNERQCRVVEYRFFGGLSFEEIAAALSVSTATVRRDWRFARAWLKSELSL